MKALGDKALKAAPETKSKYESTEFPLFDTDATEEKLSAEPTPQPTTGNA